MSLSSDQVRWVAHLARLKLSDAELSQLTGDLSKILDYVGQLEQLNTANVVPMAHPLALENVFRDDEPATSLSVSEALANAPDRRESFFAVPAVLE